MFFLRFWRLSTWRDIILFFSRYLPSVITVLIPRWLLQTYLDVYLELLQVTNCFQTRFQCSSSMALCTESRERSAFLHLFLFFLRYQNESNSCMLLLAYRAKVLEEKRWTTRQNCCLNSGNRFSLLVVHVLLTYLTKCDRNYTWWLLWWW